MGTEAPKVEPLPKLSSRSKLASSPCDCAGDAVAHLSVRYGAPRGRRSRSFIATPGERVNSRSRIGSPASFCPVVWLRSGLGLRSPERGMAAQVLA